MQAIYGCYKHLYHNEILETSNVLKVCSHISSPCPSNEDNRTSVLRLLAKIEKNTQKNPAKETLAQNLAISCVPYVAAEISEEFWIVKSLLRNWG